MVAPQPLTWPATTPGLVVLPSGRGVVGRARRALAGLEPQLVVALHRGRIATDAKVLRVDWPDFRTPRDPVAAVATLRAAYDVAVEKRVAVCCLGGRGRTGTALAVLAVIDGIAPDEAVPWVRATYDEHAVETAAQEGWVLKAATLLE